MMGFSRMPLWFRILFVIMAVSLLVLIATANVLVEVL